MFSCSMFSCNMLAVIQDLMSMTRFWMLLVIWCYDSILFGLKAMYSYVIGIWKLHWYYRAIAPSGVVYRVKNIRPSSDPWGTSKDRFRYDDRVPLITMNCLHCLQLDLNQSNGLSLTPISCSRSSSIVESIISNAPDKLSRIETALPLWLEWWLNCCFYIWVLWMTVLWVGQSVWVSFHSYNPMLDRLGLVLIWEKPLQSATLCGGFRRVGPFLWDKYSGIFFL